MTDTASRIIDAASLPAADNSDASRTALAAR